MISLKITPQDSSTTNAPATIKAPRTPNTVKAPQGFKPMRRKVDFSSGSAKLTFDIAL